MVTKILVMPPSFSDINKLIDTEIDGFILGIKDFSLFCNCRLTIDELKEILPKLKERKKKIFILLNKTMYNEDISLLKKYLFILNDFKIDGILYDDVSIVNLKEELKLNIDLVWHQIHLVTNYDTCNYWYHKHHVKYGFLSNEITLDEILDIKKHTPMSLMIMVYGYLPMFQSSRHLINNYFTYIKDKKEDNRYYIYEHQRNLSYPIYEDINGTYILSSYVLNALDELPTLIEKKMDYIVLNGLYIDSDTFLDVTSKFIEAYHNNKNIDIIKRLSNEVSEKSSHKTDKGFLYKETIYRVKNNE